jgi:hypothetical protein
MTVNPSSHYSAVPQGPSLLQTNPIWSDMLAFSGHLLCGLLPVHSQNRKGIGPYCGVSLEDPRAFPGLAVSSLQLCCLERGKKMSSPESGPVVGGDWRLIPMILSPKGNISPPKHESDPQGGLGLFAS